VNSNAIDSSLINLNNSSFTQVNSPQNNNNVIMLYNQGSHNSNNGKNPMIMTDSTHANSHSDANGSVAQKRLRSQQNYIGNLST